jgi:transcriptional regulator with XRE-family HTH domain
MSNTAGNFLSDGKQMIKVKSFGEALRLIIADSGKQYHEISNSVGCTKGDLKDWENDKGFPNANQLQRLFSIFRRLRHFAQQFKADEWATAEADGRVTAFEEIVANAAATVATTAVAAAAASIGDIGDLGLNKGIFSQCLTSQKPKDEIAKDTADGNAAGVDGTPASYINGTLVSGAQPFAVFKSAIDAALRAAGK